MRTDVFHSRRIPFEYVSPAVCDYIFSATGVTSLFLDDRTRSGAISGLTISFTGSSYRIQWDTYPGALCYSVYKLVDELDPFSAYTLVAECITDNFLDTTDPGAYFVTAVAAGGETPIPAPANTNGLPTPECFNSPPPEVLGHEEQVCAGVPTVIDVTPYVSSDHSWSITDASADVGAVSFSDNQLTYTSPTVFDGNDSAVIAYTVTDSCGRATENAANVSGYTIPVFTAPSRIQTCDDTPLALDILDYLDFNGEDQTFSITSANVFDIGGAVVFGAGTVINYTPTVGVTLGDGFIRFFATNQCGEEVTGDIPIRVLCASCGSAIKAASWTLTGGTASFTAIDGATYVNVSSSGTAFSLSALNIGFPVNTTCRVRVVGNVQGGLILRFRKTGSLFYQTAGDGPFDQTFDLLFSSSIAESLLIQAGSGGTSIQAEMFVGAV